MTKETYTSDLLFKGIRELSPEDAKLHLERLERARQKQKARQPKDQKSEQKRDPKDCLSAFSVLSKAFGRP
jgi:hypothetical protein